MADIQRQPPTTVWDWQAAPTPTATAAADRGEGASAAGGAPAVAPRRHRAAREAAAARRQGLIGGACGLLAAAALAWLLHRAVMGAVVAVVALAFALLALAAPLTLYRRLRGALDRFGHLVGTAVTWVLMTALFYLLFLPVGLAMRAAGKLGFTRFADPGLDSYWTTATGRAPGLGPYRKQF
jgi:hypothetical protein